MPKEFGSNRKTRRFCLFAVMGEQPVSREEKLKKITELTNSSLLELYTNYVRYDHYNYKSIKKFYELYKLSIRTEDLESIILERMTTPIC